MITSSHPTIPESPKTLEIQIQQLKDGIRHVVMFPQGTPVPGKARDIGMRDIVTGGNRFWFNPAKIKAGQIATASKKNELPKILGHDGYGAPDKSKLNGMPLAVVAKDDHGTPAQDIATDKRHLPPAVKGAERVKPPGGSVKVETPAKVIADRIKPRAMADGGTVAGIPVLAPRSVKVPRPVDPNRARVTAMKEITHSAANGNIVGALQSAARHKSAGTLTDQHVETALKLSGDEGLKHGFAHIPELHDAISIFKNAHPAHQALLRPILQHRITSMESRPPAEQRAILAKLHAHGLMPQGEI